MSYYQISSGCGPAECELAVAKFPGFLLANYKDIRLVETAPGQQKASRSAPGMLDAQDMATIGKAAKQYRSYPGSIPCTGCYNCIPCPQNVAIGYLFNMVYNQYKAEGDPARAKRLVKYSMSPIQRGDKPSACNECGECLAKCPQGINIPQELKRIQEELQL